MRIVFIKETAVDLATIPSSSWGHTLKKPNGDGTLGHVFPRLRHAELPDEIAQRFIDLGVAELSTVKVVWGDAPQ